MRLMSRITLLFAALLMLLPITTMAPAQDLCEFYFSTEINFRTISPGTVSMVGHGDLISDQSCVVKSNLKLIDRLGIMPVVRDLGLDAVTLPRFAFTEPPHVLFSLEQDTFSETLGPISHGDLLSELGAIERTNGQLLHAFEPVSPGLQNPGLDAVQTQPIDSHVRTGYLFSVEENFFSLALGEQISHGDLLAEAGFVYRTYEELLSAFTPVDGHGNPLLEHDFGLDAVYVRLGDEVWFSVEQGFSDATLGWVDEGDILSENGGVVQRIHESVAACNPSGEVRWGLDALHHYCRPCVIDIDKELLVRHVDVVEDPVRTTCTGPAPADCGPWTFGALMAAVAGTEDHQTVSDFVLDWLGDTGKNWMDPELLVNDFHVLPRTNIDSMIIQPWKEASGIGNPLDFSQAPFRLLAILNRPDLGNDDPEMDLIKIAEGRFVFAALPNYQTTDGFTVIFEFKVVGDTCQEAKDWQIQWHELGSMELGSPEYNAALEEITNQFATIGADPTAPNGTALSQLRTNENDLLFPSWEMREFRVLCPGDSECPSGGEQVCAGVTGQFLTETTIEQEPDVSLNGQPELTAYVNEFEDDILNGTYRVPCTYPDPESPFRAGSTVYNSIVWDIPGVSQEARDKFALNTCSGCHRAETGTGFTHIDPRQELVQSEISLFLEGDLEGRADVMCEILTTPCFSAGEEHNTTDQAPMLGRPDSVAGRVH